MVAVLREYRGLTASLRRLPGYLDQRCHHVTPRFDDVSWIGCRRRLLPTPLARKQQFLELEAPPLLRQPLTEIITVLAEDKPDIRR